MFWKKAGLLCVVLAALSIVGYAQTGARQRGSSTNLQMAMSSGYLGVWIQELNPERARALNLKTDAGVEVTKMTEGSPAARAGLHVNDVIVDINGQKVDSESEFVESIGGKTPGAKIVLSILRNGAAQKITATLGQRPPEAFPPVPPPGAVYQAIPLNPMSPEDLQAMIAAMGPKAGFDGAELTPQLAAFFGVQNGVLVFTVTEKTPAERAGMKAGDIVTKVNGIPVASPREISAILRQGKKMVTFTVVRNKKEFNLNVEVALNSAPGFFSQEAVN